MAVTSLAVLLVEDNPAHIYLAQAAFKASQFRSVLSIAKDGVEAMDYLRQKGDYAGACKPDLIFLDLNLPRKDGREVLSEIKGDPDLRRIPVVILSTSDADEDIIACYNLNANCYLVKPGDLDRFFEIIHSAEKFWLKTVTRSPQ